MKSKLTPELQEQLIKYIEAGNYVKIACQAVGIAEKTYYRWVKRGEKASELEEKEKKIPKSEKVYLDYLDTIKKAEAKAIIRNVFIIQKAADKIFRRATYI